MQAGYLLPYLLTYLHAQSSNQTQTRPRRIANAVALSFGNRKRTTSCQFCYAERLPLPWSSCAWSRAGVWSTPWSLSRCLCHGRCRRPSQRSSPASCTRCRSASSVSPTRRWFAGSSDRVLCSNRQASCPTAHRSNRPVHWTGQLLELDSFHRYP